MIFLPRALKSCNVTFMGFPSAGVHNQSPTMSIMAWLTESVAWPGKYLVSMNNTTTSPSFEASSLLPSSQVITSSNASVKGREVSRQDSFAGSQSSSRPADAAKRLTYSSIECFSRCSDMCNQVRIWRKSVHRMLVFTSPNGYCGTGEWQTTSSPGTISSTV